MNNSVNLNGIDVDKNDIDSVYIDEKRNITVILNSNKKIRVKRSEYSKRVYNELSGERSDE